MARRQPFEPDPAFEYPLPYRLAQFLLGASGQLGDYETGLGAQSKGASDVLESEARLDVSRDELRRRREESAAKLSSRQQTNQFFQNLARQGPGGAMEGITDPANMDPAALKFALEHLIPKRFEPPATAAPGVGVYNPATGQYDVKVPERPPATAAPGAGIYNPATGQYDVKVPERPPQTAAPGAGIYNPQTGQYDVRVPERPPATAAPGAGIYNPETGQYDVRVPKETPTKAASLGTAVTAELAGMGLNPETASPADIQKAINVVEGRALTRAERTGAVAVEGAAARATGPQPITGEERARVAEGERAVQLAERSLKTMETHPDWFGGPLGLQGRARQWQASLGTAPAGFAEFQSDVAEMYGSYARRIAGAALTPTEKSTYLAYLPNLKTDSDQQFVAKLKAFPERVRVLDAALERARLGTGAPAPPATPTTPSPAGIDMNAVDAELRRRGVR